MPPRWFRIAYSRNAFGRLLESRGLELSTLSLAGAAAAMVAFHAEFRPQHGERDELHCSWGGSAEGWEWAIERRMTRHDHPEARLRLAVRFAPRPGDPEGAAPVATIGEIRDTQGYRAAQGRSVRARTLDQL